MTHTVGIIPAAGLSRRMGRPKLAMPLGERKVLECVIQAVRDGGVADILVVVDPTNYLISELAAKAGADVHLLPEATPDMRATVQAGLQFLLQTRSSPVFDNWLLLPADHPTVKPAIVRMLCAVADADSRHSIFVPEHGGKRGHPTLLRSRHASRLLHWPMDQGLNQYIRCHFEDTCEIHWPNDEVLFDLDTPEDYERLLKNVSWGAGVP